MLDRDTLNSLILCKRNNVVNMLNRLKSHEGNETDRNIDDLLKGYKSATNDLLDRKVKDNLFIDFDYYSSDNQKIGYMEAVTTILGVIAWEKDRGDREKIEKKNKLSLGKIRQELLFREEFESICDTFDKIFYSNRGE